MVKKFKSMRGTQHPLSPFTIFVSLGMGFFIAIIFAIIMFAAERMGTSPWLYLRDLPGVTPNESIMYFLGTVIVAFAIASWGLLMVFRRHGAKI